MHEASLAGGILKLVEDSARREGFARVTALRLEAGQLAGVEPRALRFALEALAPGTCLDGARFEIGRIGRTTIEFFYHAADEAAARAMMDTLKASLEARLSFDAIDFEPEIVIGSSPICSDRLSDELFDVAAFAVEDARNLPDRISFADHPSRRGATDRSGSMLQDLHDAVRTGALDVHYMPKLRLADGEVVSAEALCRWTHRDHGTVPPMTFIGLAEDAGMIGDLTLFVLRRVIADQARLLANEGIAIAIDVNISALLVGSAEFCDLIIAEISRASAPIGIELTETMVIGNRDVALVNLRRIADAGIRIAIDDFGVGLSSLAYLRDLPAHELKIDQMFIRALTTSNRDPLLVRSAIDIAHALEMEVTAEGVEDEIALALLKVMRCDHVQGYHISIPLPFDQFAHYLRSQAHRQILGGQAQLRQSLSPLSIAASAKA